jgi:predicted DNA binding CopG/RHH family protein
MREHYDFSKMKGAKNPYAKHLKQSITMRLDIDSVRYFKAMSEESGIPYQTLINLYLRDCASSERKLRMDWSET